MKPQLYLVPALMLASSIAWSDPYHGGYGPVPYGVYGNRYGAANTSAPPANNPPVYGYQANPAGANSYSRYATPYSPYSAQRPYPAAGGYTPYSTPNPYRPYVNPYAPGADNTRYNAATPYESGNVANPYGVYNRAYPSAAGNPNVPYPANSYGASQNPYSAYGSSAATTGQPSYDYQGNYQAYPYAPNPALLPNGTSSSPDFNNAYGVDQSGTTYQQGTGIYYGQ